MTIALIFLLVLLVLALLIVPFARDMVKDRLELQNQTLEKKFEVLIEHLNQGLMFGDARVTTFDDDPRSLNIFSDAHANRIIHFMYSTGHLTIEMGYKYFHKELSFYHQYYNLRNITIFEQKNIARDFIERAQIKIAQHEAAVNKTTLGNIDSSASSPAGVSVDKDPTKLLDDFHSDLTKEQKMAMVNHMVIIDQVTSKNLPDSYEIPLVQQSMMLMNISQEECTQQLSCMSQEDILGLVKGIGSVHLDLHVVNCMIVTAQFAKNESEADKREIKLWATFNAMGISQEEAQNRATKIMALREMYGI